MKLKMIINKLKIIALAHLGQAEKNETEATKLSLQLTWAGWYKKWLIIGFKWNKPQIFL